MLNTLCDIEDNITQLIALTGPAGVWRKTIIDKAIAWAALFIIDTLTLAEKSAVGHRSTETPLLGIPSFSNILESCCTKVNSRLCVSFPLNLILRRLEGQFKQAETHFLAAGNRDSARLLAEMMAKWLPIDGSLGDFAVRGVVPFVFHSDVFRQLPSEARARPFA